MGKPVSSLREGYFPFFRIHIRPIIDGRVAYHTHEVCTNSRFQFFGHTLFFNLVLAFDEFNLDKFMSVEGLHHFLGDGGSNAPLPDENHRLQWMGHGAQIFALIPWQRKFAGSRRKNAIVF